MLKRMKDWVRRRFEKQDGDKPIRRFRPLRNIKAVVVRVLRNIMNGMPKWLLPYLVQGALILLGTPWWVWPLIAIAAWLLLSR